MSQNPFNEEFDRAYTNVGLFASDVWNYNKDNTVFQKSNLYLWVRLNEIEQRLAEEESEDGHSTSTEEVVRTVSDTIPFSRLASYNNFQYDEERENIYFKDVGSAQNIPDYFHNKHSSIEVWMLPEVEQEFRRLTFVSTSRWCTISPQEPPSEQDLPVPPVNPASEITKRNPCHWLRKTTWPDQLLNRYPDLPRALQDTKTLSVFKGDSMMPSYSEAEFEDKLEEFPCLRYSVETNAELELHARIDSSEVRKLWDGGFSPSCNLNAEVPEFLPTAFSGFVERSQPLVYVPEPNVQDSLLKYPDIVDDTYHADLFPYSDAHEINRFLQDNAGSPTAYSEEQKLIYNIPVFVGPPASYFNFEYDEGKFHECVTVSETSSSFVCHPGPPERPSNMLTVIATLPSYNLTAFDLRKPQEVLDFLENQLTKIYNPRAEDLKIINTASGKISKTFENIQQSYCFAQEAPLNREFWPVQKPLYSDILMKDAGSLCYNDNKYDELEREALEQYSGSDTVLLANLTPSLTKCQNLTNEHLMQNRLFRPGTESRFYETEGSFVKIRPKYQVGLADHSPNQSTCSSHPTKYTSSLSLGSKRSCDVGSPVEDLCSPNKQALWMEKPKRKLERKKRRSKRGGKLLLDQPPYQSVDNEILIISKFLEQSNKFLDSFFKSDWKLVLALLEEGAVFHFQKCLELIAECLQWMKLLLLTKEFKNKFLINSKRLGIISEVIICLNSLFNILSQYVLFCSDIKVTIPFDHRMYIDPDKCHRLAPLCYEEEDAVNQTMAVYSKALLNCEISNIKVDKFFSFVYPSQLKCLRNKNEWMLRLNYSCNLDKKHTCIEVMSRKGNFDVLLDNNEESLRFINSTSNVIKIIDDLVIWNQRQWEFADGWMFHEDADDMYSLNRINKFSITSLQYFTSYARKLLFINNWVMYSSEAIFCNKSKPNCELLWNRNGFDLLSSKMVMMKVMLKQEHGWCFGDMQVSKQPCHSWQPFCENSCCVSWFLTHHNGTMDNIRGNLVQPRKYRSSESKKNQLCLPKLEPKLKNMKTVKIESSNNVSSSEQIILEKIASGEIKLEGEEKQPSLCTLQ